MSEVDLLFGDDDVADDPVRIVLGDDNGLYRRGLLTALEDESDLEVVAEAGPGPDLVAATRALAPDVVLCSLTMPGGGGVGTAYGLTEVMPLVRVAVLSTDQDEVGKVVAAVGAGALAEVDKVAALEEAARVIRQLHHGWPVFDPATWAGVAAALPGWLRTPVSPTEQAALGALAQGGSWDAAADAAGLTAAAAANRVRNLLLRARAGGAAEAREEALAAGLLAA